VAYQGKAVGAKEVDVVQTGRPYRRLVVVADTERYSARDTVLQHEAQDAFAEALEEAGRVAGIDRAEWRRQPSGDGELAILPPDVDEPALLGGFLQALDAHLRRYNAHRTAEARIRVRIAFHQGLIFVDSRSGFAGDAVNAAARLVDAPPLKAALRAFPAANVACVVSEGIYRDVVAGGYDGIRRDRFRRVEVSLPEKGFAEWAWIQIVGEDVTSLNPHAAGDRADRTARTSGKPAAASAGVSTGDITNTGGQVAVGENARAIGTAGGSR
jgi:hypothetical protein